MPQVDAPLVADMSSTILSRPLDVSRFGLIYAGAQKNIGPSGLCVVIVRQELLGHARPGTPSVWNFKAMADDGSMLNTPPTFAWYFAGLVFKWLKRQGGVAAMGERNRAKAELLYRTIDASGFYRNPVDPACRSWMNVPFVLADGALDKTFLAEAKPGGADESRRTSLGRRHARQPVQRDVDRRGQGAERIHARIRAPSRLSAGPAPWRYRILSR